LVVDDFGIKYLTQDAIDHLAQALQEHYEVSFNWADKLHCGIYLKWDHVHHTVDLSMPGCVQAALHKFQHRTP
jgi:hypothetical protein